MLNFEVLYQRIKIYKYCRLVFFFFFFEKGFACRLAGVAFVAPVVNYGWPSLSKKLIKKDYRRGLIKWCFRISKYAPGLLHWWISQKLFPSTTSVLESNQLYFNSSDIEVLKRITGFPMLTKVNPYLIYISHMSFLLIRFSTQGKSIPYSD